MINFFRKIRKQLADDNKPLKYFRYAIGEVLLITLGIFIALQLNNWNDRRIQKEQFKITLEQLYNTILTDSIRFNKQSASLLNQIELIDRLLNRPDSLKDYLIPIYLYELTSDNTKTQASSTNYHSSNLKLNPDDVIQNEIAEQIIFLLDMVSMDYSHYDERIKHLLYENNIAKPNVKTISSSEFNYNDSTQYSREQLNRVRELVMTDKTKSILKTMHTDYQMDSRWHINKLSQIKSILRMIKSHYPEIKLLFKDVGIIGTSLHGFDNVGGSSTSMTLTDIENSIWNIDLYLKKGQVKFRCRDSWAQNWGGDAFPNGKAVAGGNNIVVNEAGKYNITLNLSELTYHFEKIQDSLDNQ